VETAAIFSCAARDTQWFGGEESMADEDVFGNEPGDLKGYLQSLSQHPEFVEEFRLARCPCGSVEFRFHADSREEVCRRNCVKCRARRSVCDSGAYARGVRLRKWECPYCLEAVVNIGVRFLLYQDRCGIWFIVVGVRCAECGRMECPLSWKVAAGPAERYLDRV
jgi:hypothetical protein